MAPEAMEAMSLGMKLPRLTASSLAAASDTKEMGPTRARYRSASSSLNCLPSKITSLILLTN